MKDEQLDSVLERFDQTDPALQRKIVGEVMVTNLIQQAEAERLHQWINDLQSGMYINCVYCGHRYGPQDEVPASMADVLKEHIEKCPEHPMSKLKIDRDELHAIVLLYRRWEHASDANDDNEGYSDMLIEASFAAQDYMERKIIKPSGTTK